MKLASGTMNSMAGGMTLAKGNSALQSGLRRRVYVATLSGQPAVDCQQSSCSPIWKKFYDIVCLHRLLGLALERNFPKRLLYEAMQAYLSERILRAGGMGGAKHTIPQMAYWLAAPWEAGLRGWFSITYWKA